MASDILLMNATLIGLNGRTAVKTGSYLIISGDTITYIGTKKPSGKFEKVIDAAGKIVMPGLINCHTHSPMSIYRGLADDTSLFEWLNDHIWPVEREFINESNIELASGISIAEMIRSGTTTFSDMYFHSDITEKVADEAGIRSVLGEAVINIPAPVFRVAEDHWEKKAAVKKAKSLSVPALVPHSPYSCSKDMLKKMKEVSKKNNILIHTHISETRSEVDKLRKETGRTPVEYLDEIKFLDKNTIAVHCVILSDSDIKILAKRQVRIVHCPQSNLKLGSGVARIREMLDAGLLIGLGTDGPASNNTLDMFSEMKTASLLHKGVNEDPLLLPAKQVFEMATIGGAKVLGLDKITGSLEKGKKADIIIVDAGSIHMTPMYDPYSHIVYSAKGSDVETVIINGRMVMENKKLLTVDEETLKKKAAILSVNIKDFKKSLEGKK
ncbi:MAG: amidohydrolase [Candidatus Delongbacteria bacterium]